MVECIFPPPHLTKNPGRLVRDPELRYTPGGVAVVNFSIAVSRPYTNQEGQRETDFFDCVAWRGKAETIANYLRKGQEVIITAALQTRYYDDNETGKRVKVTELIVDDIKFGALPKGESQSNNNQRQLVGAAAQSGSQQQGNPFDGSEPVDLGDDNLPF
ncbi:single-stranded DNA-binding protein [Bacillaceae bacterium W0354]